MIATLAGCLVQALFLLALAPGVNGLIKALKARLQNRAGPPVLQGYWDLAKWLQKSPIYAQTASWISRAAPALSFAAILTAGMLVTTALRSVPLGGYGDLIAVVYLFALARFATALFGLDAGGAFGGMGSSREMAIAALAEPVLFLALFILVQDAGSTNIAAMVAKSPGVGTAASVLAFCALYIVLVAETGRVPVDNPDTHLELTMVHEGMILEAAGPGLALFQWGAMVKQLILLSLLVDLFVPWGVAAPSDGPGWVLLSLFLYLIKVSALCAALAVTETGMAKLRIFKLPDLMGTAFALALLGLAAEAALHA
jgi:formate hydrogenlyase subunit 4